MAVLAVGLVCRLYVASVNLAKSREEMTQFLRLTDKIQGQLAPKRQQLQSQQERLARGSAISQTVGPAVLSDIYAAAEKGNNARLRELLQRHQVKTVSGSNAVDGSASGVAN